MSELVYDESILVDTKLYESLQIFFDFILCSVSPYASLNQKASLTMAFGATAIAECAFVVAVTLAAIVPRPKINDKSFFGGDLSRPFRQLLFVIACMHICRSLFMKDNRFDTAESDGTEIMQCAYYIMMGVESFSMSFLCLLMPYLLQCRLRDLINIRPGRDLLVWLYAILCCDITGIIISIWVSPKFWAIKKVGDALTCVPVLKTIYLYDNVMSRNRILDSQVTLQTLRVMESINLVAILMAAAGYWFEDASGTVGTLTKNVCGGLRLSGIFIIWARVLCHAWMLNMVDESQSRPIFVPSTDNFNPNYDNTSDVPETNTTDKFQTTMDQSLALI